MGYGKGTDLFYGGQVPQEQLWHISSTYPTFAVEDRIEGGGGFTRM